MVGIEYCSSERDIYIIIIIINLLTRFKLTVMMN